MREENLFSGLNNTPTYRSKISSFGYETYLLKESLNRDIGRRCSNPILLSSFVLCWHAFKKNETSTVSRRGSSRFGQDRY